MDLSDYHFREGLRAQKAYDELREKQQVQMQLERLQRDMLAMEQCLRALAQRVRAVEGTHADTAEG